MHRVGKQFLSVVPFVLLVSTQRTSRALMTTTMPAAAKNNAAVNTPPVFIHLFRNDLRLHDNPALRRGIDLKKSKAAKYGGAGGGGILLPVFIFDPRFVGGETTTPFGSQKCGVRRAKFLLESVADLRSNLESLGSGLVVARGRPEDILVRLCRELEVCPTTVTCTEEVASEEAAVDDALEKALANNFPSSSVEKIWPSTLYHVEDLPFDNGVQGMPDVFTPFRNKVEKKCKIPPPLPRPSKSQLGTLPDGLRNEEVLSRKTGNDDDDDGFLAECSLSYMPTLRDLGYSAEDIAKAENPDPRGVMAFRGGETAALARVKDYIFDKDLLKDYFDTRNGMLGADYSTKFSAWLANGCLSPRFVAKECRRYEEERGIVNKSTYWVVFELLWGCFFRFFAAKHGNAIFFLDGTQGQKKKKNSGNSPKWRENARLLEAWKVGKTGFPLVDANMRELAATGFMSNRGRLNVASFLALELAVDWRYGADHFEHHLLDHDVYANWGNWCAAAGMTGGRLNRFNIVKQSKDYDMEGDYVRHWCPELMNIPKALVHEPWKMTPDEQKRYGCVLGEDYPNPIIPPRMPNPYNNKNGGGGGKENPRSNNNNNKGGGGSSGRRKNNKRRSPNVGRGQRHDMKSLKEGSYSFQS